MRSGSTLTNQTNRLHISTRGPSSWRERLASPDNHWRRRFSAFETAVSWELAAKTKSDLPEPLRKLFEAAGYPDCEVLLAVAEHKVELPGGRTASQCDVWALVKSADITLSLAVEAKAKEAFGVSDLDTWLKGNSRAGVEDGNEASKANRSARWEYILRHLPASNGYGNVRYQLLHRCAAAVIEARRFGLRDAAFVVQAFSTPDDKFEDYKTFCDAIGLKATRDGACRTTAGEVSLSIGWADCPFSTDNDVADVVSGLCIGV